jgi:hypothetical protein
MKSTVIKLNSRICCAGTKTGCLHGGKLNNHLHKIMMPNYNKEFKVTTKYLFGLLILSPILNSIIMGNEI